MRVVIIGGGLAGVSAALHAAELGAEVTLIERGRVGGTAFNSGPAPVRTLANAQRVAAYLHERKRIAGHIRSAGVTSLKRPATSASSTPTPLPRPTAARGRRIG
ncbi:MAG: hypothetical protein QOJ24_613 [Mycobacterium sp.]|nr:hypothetical protein [Mycobacterium sp.]